LIACVRHGLCNPHLGHGNVVEMQHGHSSHHNTEYLANLL
jgi:hypothetical protein